MRKLISNPVKLRIERPGYIKFKLSDLGLDIKENPGTINRNSRKRVQSTPKDYTIVESHHSSHSYTSSLPRTRIEEKHIIVRVFSKTVNDEPYICFESQGKKYLLPFQFQLTQSTLSRFIRSTHANSDGVLDAISSGDMVSLKPTETEFIQMTKDAKRFGISLDNSQGEGREDSLTASMSVLRYARAIIK